MTDAYALGAFAVAVGGVVALVWVILRAVTVLSLAHRQKTVYSFDPLARRPSSPPLNEPSSLVSEEQPTQAYWPEQEK